MSRDYATSLKRSEVLLPNMTSWTGPAQQCEGEKSNGGLDWRVLHCIGGRESLRWIGEGEERARGGGNENGVTRPFSQTLIDVRRRQCRE